MVANACVGEKNQNTAVFAKLPKAREYPHFWVLNPHGNVAASVSTGPLEKRTTSHDEERLLQCILDCGSRTRHNTF